MIVREGRFSLGGFKPEGILGAVERHFRRVTGGQQAPRGLGYSEQMLARAIVCAVLEEGGGHDADGKWEADVPVVDALALQRLLDLQEVLHARIEALEASLADRDGDVGRHEQRLLKLEAETVRRIENLERENSLLQDRLSALERVPSPVEVSLETREDPRVEKLEARVASLSGQVGNLTARLKRTVAATEAAE